MSFLKKLYFLLFSILALNSLLVRGDQFEDEEGEKDVGTVIGIDLGTTYSVVGVYQNGKVDIIANDQGNRITPSYVAFTNEEGLVGESAKNQASLNPENTVYAAKRLIGRRFDEKSVQDDIKTFPYHVFNKDGKPAIRVKERGEEKILFPEEISAIVLDKMKRLAEAYLGHKVTHAVVTVPAYFNDAQRKATKDAGNIAGLEVMRVINEPTAAAIAYGLDKRQKKETNVLVYDLGGGTFDVSILSIEDGVFEVKATNGNTHLGGEDFDLNLANHLAELFKDKTGIDLKKDKKAFSKLKRESENAKRTLSTTVKANIEIENIVSGHDFRETITRALFEKLNLKLFKDTLKPVRTVLADSKMKKRDIDEVVLVGGSTRIPMVEKLLEDFFEGKKLNKGINPDEAIAYGAAVQGFILSGKSDEETRDMLLLDVTPLSLGIETVGGVYSKVITKNSQIPTSNTQVFTTNENDQTTVTISVFEGEARMTRFNHFLGRFDLTGIDKAPRHAAQIEVTFTIDANGITVVTAKDKSSGKNKKLKIDEAMSSSSSDDVKRMKENFEKHQEEDERIYNRTLAKNKLVNMLHTATEYKKKNEDQLSKEDLDDLDSLISETTKWNEGAAVADIEASEFDAKSKEIEEVLREMENEGNEGADNEGEEDEDNEVEEEKKEGADKNAKKEL